MKLQRGSHVLVVHDPLARLARRVAVGIGLLAPWVDSSLFAVIVPTLLYGLLVQPRRRTGSFRVQEGNLVDAKGQPLLARHEFTLAFPEREQAICFIRRGAVVAELTLDSGQERDRLLDELGFGDSPGPLRSDGWFGPRLRYLAITLLLGFALVTLALAGARGSLVGVLASAAVMLLATGALVHRDVRIGQDGVWVATAFRRWWVGFEQLRGVSQAGLWTRLYTERGDVDLSPMLIWPGVRSRAARDRVAHMIRRAHARFERSPSVSTRTLAAAENPPIEGDFRVAPMDLENLAAIVGSPRAIEADRVRAARTLLRSPASRGASELVRIAAQATASPALERALRVAIEEIPAQTSAEPEEELAERPARRMREGPVGSVASSHGIAPP